MSAMPKRERSFFDAFIGAREEDRQQILDMVPAPMQRIYKAQWNMADRKAGLEQKYNVNRTGARDIVDYFKEHHLPAASPPGVRCEKNAGTCFVSFECKEEGCSQHWFFLESSLCRIRKRNNEKENPFRLRHFQSISEVHPCLFPGLNRRDQLLAEEQLF